MQLSKCMSIYHLSWLRAYQIAVCAENTHLPSSCELRPASAVIKVTERVRQSSQNPCSINVFQRNSTNSRVSSQVQWSEPLPLMAGHKSPGLPQNRHPGVASEQMPRGCFRSDAPGVLLQNTCPGGALWVGIHFPVAHARVLYFIREGMQWVGWLP